MNRLSYSQKICLIGLIFTLPLALSIYIIAAQIQTEKQFAQSEKQGVEYERPLLKFLQHVQQHRGLAGALLNGDESFKDKLLAKQEQIAEDIKAINAMDAKYGAAFKSTVRWQALQEKWGSLKDKISQLNGAQSYEAHTALCAEILLFIKAIANGSNLILDPELDSYYLMDSFIDKLPVLAETLGQGRAYGIGVVTRKKATDEEHARLILLSGIMKSSLHSAQYGLDIATRQNPGITQRIDGALDEKISTATAFLEVLNQRVINRQQIDVSPKDYYDVSTRSIDANFKLSEAVGVALEDVLQARIDGLSKKMIYVFCYVAILIGLAAYLFVGFYFGITGPLKEAIRFTDEIAKGEYDKPIVISAHDEMATLGKAINQMSESISANAERERIQREREREASQELKQNVERILETVSNAAQGDLTGRLDVKGDQTIEELAFGLQCMIDNLCSLVGRVQQSGIQVASSSTQIMASAKEQEATVNEQAASAVEILATTKEISATSRQLVKTMDEVSQVAEQTSELAAEGKQGLDRLDQTMREMVNASTSIVSKLAVLSEKANNINSVVTTISKVADQTNLLSLNAAIEAEKAGEYGHGFSVVATEIRRLADQTAVATWDIEQMLKEMQSAVSAGVMGMDKFSEEIRRIVSEVGQVSGQLAKVVDQVQTLTPSFDQVLQGTQAQALGAEQITEAMSQLKETVQQTADSLRNSNDAIDQLNEAARSLQTGVSQFRVAG